MSDGKRSNSFNRTNNPSQPADSPGRGRSRSAPPALASPGPALRRDTFANFASVTGPSGAPRDTDNMTSSQADEIRNAFISHRNQRGAVLGGTIPVPGTPVGSPQLSPLHSPLNSPLQSPFNSPQASPANSPLNSPRNQNTPVNTPPGSPSQSPRKFRDI